MRIFSLSFSLGWWGLNPPRDGPCTGKLHMFYHRPTSRQCLRKDRRIQPRTTGWICQGHSAIESGGEACSWNGYLVANSNIFGMFTPKLGGRFPPNLTTAHIYFSDGLVGPPPNRQATTRIWSRIPCWFEGFNVWRIILHIFRPIWRCQSAFWWNKASK